MIKAMLLTPTGTPEVVEVKNDYRDIKRVLGIKSPVDVAYRKIGGEYFDIWIDDEGLFKEQEDGTVLGCAYCENAQEMLSGKILIARSENEEMASLTDEDIVLIYENLKRITKDVIVDYNTSIGLKRMKFVKSGIVLCYSV